MNTTAPVTVMAMSVKSEYLPGSVDLQTLKDQYHTHAQIEAVGVACAVLDNMNLNVTDPSPEVVALSGEAYDLEDSAGSAIAHLAAALHGIMDLRPGSLFVTHTQFPFRQLGGRYRFPLPPHIDIATLARELFGHRRVSLPYLCEVYGVNVTSRPNVVLDSREHSSEQIMDLAAWDATATLRILAAMAADNRAVAALMRAATIYRSAARPTPTSAPSAN